MKELSIEEKAKRYDEAIEIARKINSGEGVATPPDWTVCEVVFPELKESEDKRMVKFIKKQLFNIKKTITENYELDAKLTKAIDWLEKQGEHANFCSKIQVGDKVTRNQDGVLVNLSQLKRVAKKDEKQAEQKPIFEIKTPEESLGIDSDTYSKIVDECIYGEQKPAEWSSEQSKTLQTDNVPYESSPNAHLWTRAIGFDEESMESKPCEQKSSWSEEDEKMLEYAINMIEWYSVVDKRKSRLVSAWLKSLKERYTWKPSDEQMDALHYVTNFDYGGHKATLVSLYEQLKKLKG